MEEEKEKKEKNLLILTQYKIESNRYQDKYTMAL